MRSEKEMLDLILNTAKKDERIRAVYMNGSRTNPNAGKDIFQDYDIVYVVTETKPFIEDKGWLKVFGEIIVMQEPDINVLYEEQPQENSKERYAFLMQFMDGNRIDLTIQTWERTQREYLKDQLTLPLLDKDGILPKIQAPTDQDYHVKKPTKDKFLHCCNEFWWVSPYIAKGLWRKEILYSMDHMNYYVRPMLLMMLSWQAGLRTGFSVSVGKCHKYLDHYLPEAVWQKLLKTYPMAEVNSVWNSLFAMGELFRESARYVADRLGYTYNLEEDLRTTDFLKDIRKLPRDAKEIR